MQSEMQSEALMIAIMISSSGRARTEPAASAAVCSERSRSILACNWFASASRSALTARSCSVNRLA